MTKQSDLFGSQPEGYVKGSRMKEVGVVGIMDRNKAYCAACVDVTSYERGFIYTDHPVGRKCEWCGVTV